MKTILKFPVYIEIDTDNVDRARVSSLSKEVLYPLLLNYLASARVRKDVLGKMSEELKSPVSVQILTELDLIHTWISKESPSTSKVLDV